MELRRRGEGSRHRPPVPDAPTVEVLFGGDEGGPDVAVVRVEIPAGSGMPPHSHGGSDVILVPIDGAVEITKDDETIHVGVGDSALIRRDEVVALRNPGSETAEVVVAAGPVDFVAGLRSWPPAD